MTANEGHHVFESIRQLCTQPGHARPSSSRGELRERAGALPGHEPVERAEGARLSGTRRAGCGPCRGENPPVPFESSRSGPARAGAVSGSAPGARSGAPRAGGPSPPQAPADGEAAVRLAARSSLADVAVAVGDALRRAGIRGVLTGGACASLYSAGAFHSVDVDIVLEGTPTVEAVDAALSPLGFKRRRDRYVHSTVPFFVEFPRGPLGIGEDFKIRPVWRARRGARALALSATDACRDRLAAFYHWNDRQSLGVAVAIARRHRVQLLKIREWSRREGHAHRYATFLDALARARRASNRRAPK